MCKRAAGAWEGMEGGITGWAGTNVQGEQFKASLTVCTRDDRHRVGVVEGLFGQWACIVLDRGWTECRNRGAGGRMEARACEPVRGLPVAGDDNKCTEDRRRG